LKDVGLRIRRLRQAAEMTQDELAERAELTASFISKLERGVLSISLESLLLILDALNVHISDFFRPERERVVFREGDSVQLEREGVEEFTALVPGGGTRRMEPVRVRLQPGQEVELEVFSGEQFGYVLRGVVTVSFGRERTRAAKGHCFYADGRNEMKVANRTERSSEFLWITSPPYF
jgi:transcriptional regulator with XRE-family HTH domain